MNKRKLIISLIGVGILVMSFVISSNLSSPKPESTQEKDKEVATVVRTAKVSVGEVNASIQVTGRVIAAERVDLFAEVNGISSYGSKPFKAGTSFKKGDVLLRIDSREFSSSLSSTKSQFMSTLAQVLPDLKLDYPDVYPTWKDYMIKLDVSKSLPILPEVKSEQLKLFLTGRNIYSSYYGIKEAETRLSKYVIRAPFTGSLTDASINQGTLVRSGQKLGEFIKSGLFELEGSVPYDQLNYLKKGMQIGFTDINTDNVYTGKLVRINEKVDPNTQLVKVYFQLNDTNLKSGLYLRGDVSTSLVQEAVKLPIQSLVENQFVFLVVNGKASKQPIKVISQDASVFIATGVPEGAEVIIDKKNSAFEGSTVIAM